MTVKELMAKRAKLIADARALHTAAQTDKRDLTAEERKSFDKMMDDADKLVDDIKTQERLLAAEADVSASAGRSTQPEPPAGANGTPAPGGTRTEDRTAQVAEAHMDLFRAGLRDGPSAVFRGMSENPELRALQADVDIAGGYLKPPQQWVNELIKFVDNLVFIRKLARVIPVTTSDSLGAPKLSADPADATWTTEIQTGSEDSTMATGKRELHPHPLAKLLKASNKLIRVSAIPIEQLIRERLGYKFAVTEEKAFLTGSGAQQPLGVFTASADGISTGQDVSTDNTTTAITADGLVNAKYGLKAQYWPTAQWVFHRDAMKQIALLKDGEGRYMFQNSLLAGQPDRLLNFSLNMSEYAPNTFETGLYVGILGDFSQYWIADALNMTVQRLVELYAATNQVGFIGRMELDGAPVLEEAFIRVTLG